MIIQKRSSRILIISEITIFFLIIFLSLITLNKNTLQKKLMDQKVTHSFNSVNEYVVKKLHFFIVDERKKVANVRNEKINPLLKNVKVLTKSFGDIKFQTIKKNNLLNNIANM